MFMEWMIKYGLWSLALLMLLQNLIPLLPSEVIMPLAGYLASQGYMDLGSAIVAGLVGSLLGHIPWYAAGHAAGNVRLLAWSERHGRWVGLRPDHIRHADAWFHQYAGRTVMLGRLIPGFRTLVNIPAGASRMPLMPFLGYTTLGDALWTACLAWAGFTFGHEYQTVSWYLHAVLTPIALLGAAILFRHKRRRHVAARSAPAHPLRPALRTFPRQPAFRARPWRLRLPGLPRGA